MRDEAGAFSKFDDQYVGEFLKGFFDWKSLLATDLLAYRFTQKEC